MELSKENINKSTISGIFWKSLERILAQSVSLIVSIILAILLTPDDYGSVGVVTIFFAFANVIITGGFSTALIQKKDTDIYDYSSVLWISVIASSVIYLILFFTAPYISSIYKTPILTPIFRVMGLELIVSAIKAVLVAYTSNLLDFKKFFWSTFFGTIISAFIGISLAYKGYGPWALVLQQMSNTFIDTLILFITTKFIPKFKISISRLKGLLSYGWKMLVASLISTTYDQTSPLIIGLKYTTSDLSFFTKGKSFPSAFNNGVISTIGSVIFPVLSKIQDDKKATLEYTRKFIRLSAFIIFPAMLGMFAISDNFILAILKEKWLPASFYLKLFCISYMFDIIQCGNLQAIRASGRSDIILKTEILKKSLYFIVIAIAVFFGKSPKALAITYIINAIIATLINTYPNTKLIGYAYHLQIKDIVVNLFPSLIMCIITYFVGSLIATPLLSLLCQMVTGIVSYILISLLINKSCAKEFLNIIKSFVKKEKTNEG